LGFGNSPLAPLPEAQNEKTKIKFLLRAVRPGRTKGKHVLHITTSIWFRKRENLNNSLFFKSPFSIFYYKKISCLGQLKNPCVDSIGAATGEETTVES
jgi:hypothetical protein